jgi:hypothetical protein
MYSFLMSPEVLTARTRPAEAYDWFVYKARTPVVICAHTKIQKGTKFGICRDQQNAKKAHVVIQGHLGRVLTISIEVARALAKGV